MALCALKLVETTSSGGEGASQKQPQAKQEDAKHHSKDRRERHVGRQCYDAGVAADSRQIHEGALFPCQPARVKRQPRARADRLRVLEGKVTDEQYGETVSAPAAALGSRVAAVSEFAA